MDIQKELIAEYDRETASTRKILEAIPDDADFAWKPHDKSMTLGRLAGHVSDTNGDWAMHTLTRDRLDWSPDMKPDRSHQQEGPAGALREAGGRSQTCAGRHDAGQVGFELEIRRRRSDLDRRHQVQRLAHLGAESPRPSPRAAWRLSAPARQKGSRECTARPPMRCEKSRHQEIRGLGSSLRVPCGPLPHLDLLRPLDMHLVRRIILDRMEFVVSEDLSDSRFVVIPAGRPSRISAQTGSLSGRMPA